MLPSSLRSSRLRVLTCFVGSVVFAGAARPAVAQDHRHTAGERLGTVQFQTSCTEPAKAPFNHAMALLHSFEFGPAIDAFNETLKADPGCAMAHWGIAVARWSNPFAATVRQPAQIKQGLDAIARARQAAPATDRERAYIEAAAELYRDAESRDQRSRVVAYEKAMAALAAAYPGDREASIFWALSLTASALPTDKTYANQLKAGAILEGLAAAEPDHPGITHYIIHSYDVPALASRAAQAAERYAQIAPSAPHALHMPSHTFTRVGAWQESIDTNIASAEAARRVGATAEELHAMDYQAYAYLQTGQDGAARALMDRLPAIGATFNPDAIGGAAPGSAGVFALAAIPARWALERRDWTSAARLEAKTTRFPYADAMTHFARALGAARTGAPDEARRAIAALAGIRAALTAANEGYWAEQVGIQHDIATAFLALAEGRHEEAVKTMRAAAAREDATDKNAVTPGPLAPARELLGDMLLGLNRPAEALAEYRMTLTKEPNRFRAVYGAARAAQFTGDAAGARTYFTQLLKICERADAQARPELVEARKAVGVR
jgi:hypothetical protein